MSTLILSGAGVGRERLVLAAKRAHEDVVKMVWERRDFNPHT